MENHVLQGFHDEPEARLARLQKLRVKKNREGMRYRDQRDQKVNSSFMKNTRCSGPNT